MQNTLTSSPKTLENCPLIKALGLNLRSRMTSPKSSSGTDKVLQVSFLRYNPFTKFPLDLVL